MNYRLTSDEMAKKFDDIRKSEAKKWKDFFDETDKMIYGDDKKKDETPKPSVQEYMKAKDRVKAYEDKYKKDMDDYEYMERIRANGVNTSLFNPMYGRKPKPLEEIKSYMEELNKIKAYEGK